jgi:phage-related protein
MPSTDIAFYAENQSAPVLNWLEDLYRVDKKAAAECIARIRLLAQFGHELRRPHADFLRDGIYELRAKRGRVQYRILYFFHGRNVALLAHGLTKEGKVPAIDIQRAIERKKKYEKNPAYHTAVQTLTETDDLERKRYS